MLVNFLLSIIVFIAGLIIGLLPGRDFIPIPSGITDAFGFITDMVSSFMMFVPTGFVSNLAAAIAVVFAANLFVIPWLVARKARLPFRKAVSG